MLNFDILNNVDYDDVYSYFESILHNSHEQNIFKMGTAKLSIPAKLPTRHSNTRSKK